jgi:hypothetical protein
MLEPLPERELRQHVARAKLRPEANTRDAGIHRALMHIIDKGSVFYVLADTPGQCEDYFSILADDNAVVNFELDRHAFEALPAEVGRYSLEEFRRDRSELTARKLRIALELARRDLGKNQP